MKYTIDLEIEFILVVVAIYQSQEFSDLAREDIERFGASKAKRVVKDSMADALESISHGTRAQTASLNKQIMEKGLPTIEYMTAKYTYFIKNILTSKQVNGESDVLLLREALEDGLISGADATLAQELIKDY